MKERFQNPTCGDTIGLRLFTYNSNNRRNVQSIEKVDIYFLDRAEISAENPDGRRLVQSIDGSEVTQVEDGQYLLELATSEPSYVIGKYLDVWSVIFEDGECATAEVPNPFQIYPDLWFTTPVPPIYDFNITFRPTRIPLGTKRYFIIQITPNIPRGADLLPYYENLAIVSDIRVSIELACGDCVPAEKDLRLLVDRKLVDYREKLFAYYFIDTNDYDPGIYNIWFEIAYGESTYVTEKNQFQISN